VAASVSLSPSERSQTARIAAYAQKAQHDPKETTLWVECGACDTAWQVSHYAESVG
jgi:hypothetical protein